MSTSDGPDVPTPVPGRVRRLGTGSVGTGDFVLYWMTSARRSHTNFALDRALQWSAHLGKPLLVLEGLRVDYVHASDRFHAFVLQGMVDNLRAFQDAGVRYLPWVEHKAGDSRGLIKQLAQRASVVVADDSPAFFFPRMLDAAASAVDVYFEAVDSCGLLPFRTADRDFTRAHSFRRYLQHNLPEHLEHWPKQTPLADYEGGRAKVPAAISKRYRFAKPAELNDITPLLASLPIDHEVDVVAPRGGSVTGAEHVHRFVDAGLRRYGEHRNHPDEDASSGLSPWLHFGQVSSHQILRALAEVHDWTPASIQPPNGGSRQGWWGMDEAPEAFMDQVVTWRELGFNLCARRDDYAATDSLPSWALRTIAEHADDVRDPVYSLEQLQNAQTHDPIWNAAQTQLVREGRIHNYMRMLWGKLIYQWSANANEAMATMVHLNDRWALDGRDPNSYSGIGWVLGRFDRAWGPERPVFGKLRMMTSASARRKLRLRNYLTRYGSATAESA